MSRPSGEFGSTIEKASLTGEAEWLTGPLVQNIHSISEKKVESPLYRHWVGQFTLVGQTFTAFTDSGFPDYWSVYLLPTWSGIAGQLQPSVAAVYQSPSAGREAELVLTGGGYCRIPGTSEYLTIEGRVIGTNAVNFGIMAVRKSDTEVYIDPGNG
jgi:hypothetical protein